MRRYTTGNDLARVVRIPAEEAVLLNSREKVRGAWRVSCSRHVIVCKFNT